MLNQIKIAAEQGDARAQYRLGKMYATGRDVAKDEKKAVEWFEKAAKQEGEKAQYELGSWYSSLGEYYYYGEEGCRGNEGIGKDEKQAAKWFEKAVEAFEKAAKQGDAKAQYELGKMYATGRWVAENAEKAVEWFEKAAKQAGEQAQCELGNWYTSLGNKYYFGRDGLAKDEKKAAVWFEKAVKLGYAEAQRKLGEMYATGRGVAKDEKKAVEWFEKAAEQEEEKAQYELGSWYASLGENYYYGEDYGDGRIAKDKKQAAKWFEKATEAFEKAAEQGDAEAQNELGEMYAIGKYVAKDENKAIEWFEKAAKQEGEKAQYQLGNWYTFLGNNYYYGEDYSDRGIAKDEKQAAKWFERAAEQGYAEAQRKLGEMYATGRGVAKDEKKAVEWFEKAAEQGDAEAQRKLEKICAIGDGVDKDEKMVDNVSNKRLSSDLGDAASLPPAKKPKLKPTSLTADEKAKYCCPISGKIFSEPVLAYDNKYYEREVWQKQHLNESFIIDAELQSEIEKLLQTKLHLRSEVYISQSARDFMLKAIQEDKLDLFMRCLKHKGLLFARNDKKQSWLHCILNNTLTDNRIKMVSELLEKNIDVSLRDAEGNLALHLAVKQGNTAIVSKLLEAHAKQSYAINHTNKKGQTPFSLAEEGQHKAIIELLSPQYGYKLHWVKDNTLTYKNDKCKVSLQINAGNFFQHYTRATKNSKDASENIVYGSLTFLLRIKQGEQYVYNTLEVPLSFGDNLHVSKVYDTEAELLKDVKRYNSTQKEEVEKLEKQWENAEKEPDQNRQRMLLFNFHQKLHHSERALFKKLESKKSVEKIVYEFNKFVENHYSDTKPGHIKIKMVILDMFSTRYLCKLCEPATGYFQSPGSPFLRKLSNALVGYKYQVSKRNEMKNPFYSNLPYMLTRVGATMPANLQPVKPFAKHEDTLFNLHDLKKQGKQLILQTDLDQKLKNDPHTAVSSRKQKDPRGLSIGSHIDMADTPIPVVEISDDEDISDIQYTS